MKRDHHVILSGQEQKLEKATVLKVKRSERLEDSGRAKVNDA